MARTSRRPNATADQLLEARMEPLLDDHETLDKRIAGLSRRVWRALRAEGGPHFAELLELLKRRAAEREMAMHAVGVDIGVSMGAKGARHALMASQRKRRHAAQRTAGRSQSAAAARRR